MLTLEEREAHVWSFTFHDALNHIARYSSYLSSDERADAETLRYTKDREKRVLARGFIREVLAAYTGTHPSALCFRYGESGKPSLANDAHVCFNLSHSYGLAVCAVANDDVGVDVEYERPLLAFDDLVAKHLAHDEAETIRALPAEKKTREFLRFWTLKEAYVKATGEGIVATTGHVTFSLEGERAEVTSIHKREPAANAWTARLFTPAKGYVGALVTKALLKHLRIRTWNER